MRVLAAVLTVLTLMVALGLNAGPSDPPAAATDNGPRWVKLTFGLDGKAEPWDGRATVEGGRLLESVPWSFEKRDRFDSASHKWFCTTVVLEGRSASSFAEPQRGALLHIAPEGDARIHVETKQGRFTVALKDLVAGKPQLFLDRRASAELLGPSQMLPDRRVDSDAATEDDFPTLAIDGQGRRWIAWIGYDDANKRDHLYTLCLDDPQARTEEIVTAREQLGPRLLTDGEGALWLFFAAPQDGNWDLWATRRTADGWQAPQRITTAEGTDFHLAAARGPQGELWLAWQAFRRDNSDIVVKCRVDNRWSDEIVVARSPANEWEPSISIDPEGRAWIGYDSYENGNYDVFLTSVALPEDGTPQQGPTAPVAVSEDFEAHASVEATGDAVWIAYDAAGPGWGKDFTRESTTFRGKYAEPLHASRRIELRAFVDGKLMQPTAPVPQKFNKRKPEIVTHSKQDEVKRFYELPQLARDGNGRLWVFFRLNRQGYAGHPPMGMNWEVFATTFADGRWIEPILLPPSKGRQNQRVATAADRAGRLHVAWSTGDHHVDLPYRVRIGKIPAISGDGTEPLLEPAVLVAATPSSEPTIRSWTAHHKGESYQVYFGDLHRHTTISLCTPMIDGCLVDAYRYALDAARQDFLAVTDHTRDTDPYPWWRTQKANDLFLVKGAFAPIYAYERSNGIAGGGHRNVFFLERDWPVFRGDAHYSSGKFPRPENNNPDVALYPHLRGKQALTAAHTPGYSRRAKRGTWTYHDPQVEPIAEIIQTHRRDYLKPGTPQWREARVRGNLSEEASVWYALARGYKLGFIASSDHHATHTSYACVWAAGPGRGQIFEGLQSRRTYAATDKILLEVRMGEAFMGEEIDAPEIPELTIRAVGTAPITEIQVVRDRTVIATLSPEEIDVQTTVRDPEYPGGAAYYYVRLRQSDDNMAWSSPIWVR